MSLTIREGTIRCRVLPVVYAAILDHYTRRSSAPARVIGTLLGVVNHDVVEITNCFPVPHSESDDQVAMDMEYHQTMFELYQRVNSKEMIVGWYATGAISTHTELIHEFYQRHTPNAIHLLVDTSLHANKMSLQALIGSPLGVSSGTAGILFTPIESEVIYHDIERVGLEVLQRRADSHEGITLFSDIDHIDAASTQILELITKAEAYVTKVVNGDIKGDVKIGRYLLDTVSAVPKIDVSKFETMFNNTLQDLLMVVYLANLTKTQVMLQEKLSKSL